MAGAPKIKAHNLVNFPKLKDLPGVEWKEAENNQKDEKGNIIEVKFKYPTFKTDHYPAIIEIVGAENLIAILNDESRRVYRTAPTPEKLMSDAVIALVRLGFTREKAEELINSD